MASSRCVLLLLVLRAHGVNSTSFTKEEKVGSTQDHFGSQDNRHQLVGAAVSDNGEKMVVAVGQKAGDIATHPGMLWYSTKICAGTISSLPKSALSHFARGSRPMGSADAPARVHPSAWAWGIGPHIATCLCPSFGLP